MEGQPAQVTRGALGVGKGRLATLTKRRWIILALVVVVAAAALAWVAYAQVRPLEVTVRNETGQALPALWLRSEATGQRTAVPGLAASDSVSVKPALGPSEDQLRLVDARGRSYVLLGYVEGDPGGNVTVTITGATPDGLTGRVLDETRYSASGESVLKATVE